ncbi:MAG: hypothetical protein U9N34_09495 [Candidatus Cloacimonadota bacterium]|nr:hypothetical protein [Candidatus Cloacimonadota bacterium]
MKLQIDDDVVEKNDGFKMIGYNISSQAQKVLEILTITNKNEG